MLNNASATLPGAVRRWTVIGDIGAKHSYHVGDEAMFEANIHLLRSMAPQAQLLAVSRDPEFTAATYGVKAVHGLGFESCESEAACEELLARWTRNHWTSRLPSAFDALTNEADGLVISGGGNLNSTWPEYIYERLALCRKAVSIGAPVILLGQTIGPELNARQRAMVSEILRVAAWVGAREMASYELALELGASPQRLSFQIDDASGLEKHATAELRWPLPFAADERWIGVTFHPLCDPTGSDPLLDQLARQLELVAAQTGCRLVFIPHARANVAAGGLWSDEEMGHALAARIHATHLHVLPVLPAMQVAQLTARASLVVSSRYHPLVFALAAGVPCFGVWSDEYTRIKLQGALHHYGCAGDCCGVPEVVQGQLASNVLALWAHASEMRARLSECGDVIVADEQLRRDALARWMLGNQTVNPPRPARFDQISAAMHARTASGPETYASARNADSQMAWETRSMTVMGQTTLEIDDEGSVQANHSAYAMKMDESAQAMHEIEAERCASSLMEVNAQLRSSLEESIRYARSLEGEILKMRDLGAEPEDSRKLTKAVAQMREEILELNHALQAAYDQMAQGDREEVGRLRGQIGHLTATVDALHASSSWRITKPLRTLYSLLTGR
ncbi:hypothetical protein G7048_21200 [Diaphorobacter sp. HDW4B]|uniref:polysaccharide pyruvyl transferase family protein n=1 Tax=Diaphorobacter sp. HDW4B TaxID=2714925 RepID=UPI001407554E|nr:polysaccharide pyruvyl transferase family protein [Diaphorobacter sp. HDW4B]QIL72646.1 hypothetical protein G7048_21200 [Diaphorobacter sp. HDW4B]